MSDPMEDIQPILHTHAEAETKEDLKAEVTTKLNLSGMDLTVSWTQALEATGLSEDEIAKIINEPELTDDELDKMAKAMEEDADEDEDIDDLDDEEFEDEDFLEEDEKGSEEKDYGL